MTHTKQHRRQRRAIDLARTEAAHQRADVIKPRRRVHSACRMQGDDCTGLCGGNGLNQLLFFNRQSHWFAIVSFAWHRRRTHDSQVGATCNGSCIRIARVYFNQQTKKKKIGNWPKKIQLFNTSIVNMSIIAVFCSVLFNADQWCDHRLTTHVTAAAACCRRWCCFVATVTNHSNEFSFLKLIWQ